MFSISAFDSEIEKLLSPLKNRNEIIYSAILYTYKSGGKRVRPKFCLLCSEIFGREDRVRDIILSSVCIELLHTASLMIDDVIDNSEMRRGKPSANAVFGNKIAVTSASYLIGLISEIISDIGDIDLIKMFSQTSKLMAEGETFELNIMIDTAADLSKSFLLKSYFEVVEKKTASLFALSSSTPAIIYDKRYIDIFSKLGFLTGIAFQIKDDILDFMPSEKTGKPSMKDIKEGKITLPVILSDNFERIIELFKNSHNPTEEKTKLIYELVVHGNGIKKAEEHLRKIQKEINQILSEDIFSPRRKELLDFINFLIERDF